MKAGEEATWGDGSASPAPFCRRVAFAGAYHNSQSNTIDITKQEGIRPTYATVAFFVVCAPSVEVNSIDFIFDFTQKISVIVMPQNNATRFPMFTVNVPNAIFIIIKRNAIVCVNQVSEFGMFLSFSLDLAKPVLCYFRALKRCCFKFVCIICRQNMIKSDA